VALLEVLVHVRHRARHLSSWGTPHAHNLRGLESKEAIMEYTYKLCEDKAALSYFFTVHRRKRNVKYTLFLPPQKNHCFTLLTSCHIATTSLCESTFSTAARRARKALSDTGGGGFSADNVEPSTSRSARLRFFSSLAPSCAAVLPST